MFAEAPEKINYITGIANVIFIAKTRTGILLGHQLPSIIINGSIVFDAYISNYSLQPNLKHIYTLSVNNLAVVIALFD